MLLFDLLSFDQYNIYKEIKSALNLLAIYKEIKSALNLLNRHHLLCCKQIKNRCMLLVHASAKGIRACPFDEALIPFALALFPDGFSN